MKRGNMPDERSVGNSYDDIPTQDLIDGIQDELVIIDADYRIKFANAAAQSRFQNGESPIGKLCYEVLHQRGTPCSAPLWDCRLMEVLDGGRTTTDIHPTPVHGANTYLKITMHPLRDETGNINAVVELNRDVTAARELETQILRRRHQLLALSHISSAPTERWSPDAILRISLDIALETVNGTIGGIMLLDEETGTLYYRLQRGMPAKYAEEIRLKLGEGIAGTVAQTGQPILLNDVTKDPRIRHYDLVKTEGLRSFVSVPLKTTDRIIGVMNVASRMPGQFSEGDLYLLTSIGHHIGIATEQAGLYERLARASERYQTLLQRSLTAQEEERKRIARELHDETSQLLTSLALSLQAVIGMAEARGIGDAEFMEKLKRAHSHALHAGGEVVKLMKELRPTLLDELGMATAIRRYAKDTLEPQGITVNTEFLGTEERIWPEVEVTLFRVAQGAVGNILKHSEAKKASIRVECSARECILQVEDDGKGFNVKNVTGVDTSGRGAGLFTMKERVKLVGGFCRIDSGPGQGTKVFVKVPLTKDTVGEEEDKGADS
jgi:signal transduction histidine kinase